MSRGATTIITEGDVFGLLEVVRELPRLSPDKHGHRKREFLMLCRCGNERPVRMCNLRTSSRAKKCGCVKAKSKRGLRGGYDTGVARVIFANEAPHASKGIDVRRFNRVRPLAANSSQLQSNPLHEIYTSIKNAKPEDQKALMNYAVDFYGPSCVVNFFERCERAA